MQVRSLWFSLLVYFNAGAVLVVVGLPLLVVLLAAPQRWYVRRSFVFWLLDLFYKSVLAAFMVPITVEGRENLVLDRPNIVIANHESLLDIFIIGALFNGEPHIWYALAYYAHMPVFGFLVRHLVFAVNPGRPAEAARGFMRGLRYAEKHGLHLALFPEGGRFNDGSVHPFMRGFAVAARALQRPVVPVLMSGNGAVYAPTSWLVFWHELAVFVGPCFFIDAEETDLAFVEKLQDWFATARAKQAEL